MVGHPYRRIIRPKGLFFKCFVARERFFSPAWGPEEPPGHDWDVPMNEQRIVEELLALLEANHVKIRREPLGGRGGGLASMKGENLFFVDTEASSADVAALCADAVRKLVDIETIYLRPEIRLFLESQADPAF
jgi:hypothetical protein